MAFTQHDDLRDHNALVTGATSGIGRAIAVQFARMGAEVLVHGRDATRGSQVVAEVVGFLASPRASHITGAIVAADGGRTAI